MPVNFFDAANFLEPIEETLEVDDGSFKEQGIFFEHEGVPSTTCTHFLLGMWFLFLSECSKNKGKYADPSKYSLSQEKIEWNLAEIVL
jgi:hypothetical protein